MQELSRDPTCTDRTVLNDESFVCDEQRLEWSDNAPEVILVFMMIEEPLRVEHVVHRDETLVLAADAGTHATQFRHLATHAQQEAQVHAQGADIRARLA